MGSKKKLSKSVSGYSILRPKKKEKKVAWTTKPLGGGGLSGPTTKKTLFYVCLLLPSIDSTICFAAFVPKNVEIVLVFSPSTI